MESLISLTAGFLRSRRGLAIVIATGFGLLAILLRGSWATLAAAMAVLLLSMVLTVLSIRVSQLHVHKPHKGASGGVGGTAAGGEAALAERVADTMSARRVSEAIQTLREAQRPSMGRGQLDHAPLVTVVVPCFNEDGFVAETLRSVRLQSLEDFECIVVDDASTDGSVRVIWDEIASDSRFRLLRHRVNSGLGASRNTGLRAARGEFVTFLDSDDLLTSESLVDRVATLYNARTDKSVIGAFCGVRVELEEVTLDELPRRFGANQGTVVDFIAADAECPFNAHAPLLITDLVRSLGGFNESMRHGAEDWDLWYRALRNGFIFVPSQWTTAVYRQKRSSMIRTMSESHMREADMLISAAYKQADSRTMRSPTTHPFWEPLPYYREQIRKVDRAVRFAAMAMMAGDTAAARRTLETHRGLPLGVLQRHLDIEDLTSRGMRRALALDPDELSLIGNSIAGISRALTQILVGLESEPPEQEPWTPETVEAVMIPQHAGQARPMIDAAAESGLDASSLVVLDVSREAGDQGALKDVPDGMRRVSLNEWVLDDMRAKNVVVGSIRIGAVDLIASAISAGGARVVEVPQSLSSVMSIDEGHHVPSQPFPRDGLVGIPASTDVSYQEPASVWSIEEYPTTIADSEAIEEFRGVHKGERVVIIGNGPSLNSIDLSKLKNEYTFAVNAIFYASDQMGFDPSYYVVEDTAVMKDNLEEIKRYRAGHKFFPSIYREMVGEAPNITYFMMNRGFYEPASPDFCIPRFSLSPGQCIYSGQSVTIINLQLAYHMGFTEVALVGMDFSYTIPESAEVDGDVITSTSDDPNHFHPDYFGTGKVWKDPKLERVLANYALAKEIYEADGRRIVNATVGGKLELFDRVPYDEYFG